MCTAICSSWTTSPASRCASGSCSPWPDTSWPSASPLPRTGEGAFHRVSVALPLLVVYTAVLWLAGYDLVDLFTVYEGPSTTWT